MPDTIFALANRGDIFFAAYSTGLLRSTDAGSSWEPVWAGSGTGVLIPASTVAFSGQVSDYRPLFAAVPGGILRSFDAGTTWESALLPSPAPFVTALAFSPDFEHDQTLFAASLEDGVFRSTDGGASWAAWNFGLLDYQVLSLVTTPENGLYAGTGTGLFASYNGGRAWREIALPCGNVPILSLASASGLLLAGTDGSGLYASMDRAQSWQRMGSASLDDINSLILDGSALLALTLDALLLSRDAGQTWFSIPGLVDDELPSQVLAPGGLGPGGRLLLASTGGLRWLVLP